jgi:hypothetical protein
VRRICPVIFKRELSGIHIDHIGTKNILPSASGASACSMVVCAFNQNSRPCRSTPVVVLQRDVNILLAVQITGITAHAALQPVIFLIVTRFIGEFVIWRTRGGDPDATIASL